MRRRKYNQRSIEEKRLAVKRYIAGDKVKDIRADYDIHSSTMYEWIDKYGEEVQAETEK